MNKNSPKTRPEIILAFKERLKLKRTTFDVIADFLTNYFGTVSFLILNIIFFIIWVVLNLKPIPGIGSFDPYPFNFLTMVVSLEAILLSVVVLISQNRAGKIADLREEIDFAINAQAEKEITRTLKMLDEIHDHLGLRRQDDRELIEMKKEIDIDEIEKRLEKE